MSNLTVGQIGFLKGFYGADDRAISYLEKIGSYDLAASNEVERKRIEAEKAIFMKARDIAYRRELLTTEADLARFRK